MLIRSLFPQRPHVLAVSPSQEVSLFPSSNVKDQRSTILFSPFPHLESECLSSTFPSFRRSFRVPVPCIPLTSFIGYSQTPPLRDQSLHRQPLLTKLFPIPPPPVSLLSPTLHAQLVLFLSSTPLCLSLIPLGLVFMIKVEERAPLMPISVEMPRPVRLSPFSITVLHGTRFQY